MGSHEQSRGFEIPITLNGVRQPVHALIDSGATHSFIHHTRVKEWKLPTKTLESPLNIYTVDGSEHKDGQVTKYIQVPSQIGDWKGNIRLLITDLHDSTILLGADWLISANQLFL